MARHVSQTGNPEAGGNIAGQLFLPAPLHLRLNRHRLERLDSGNALDQEGLVFCAALELFVQTLLEQRRRACGYPDIEWKRSEDDPGQERRVEEQYRDEDHRKEQVDDQGQPRTGQEITDIFEFTHTSD